MAQSAAVVLAGAEATVNAGRHLARAVLATRPAALVIYLEGDLGAGKTTLARGFLEALGHGQRVPSPTYTLIEPYALSGYRVYHVDLYRIRTPAELDDLALAEQMGEGTITLIEWPDHGAGRLPRADITLRFGVMSEARSLECGASSPAGTRVLESFRQRGIGRPMLPGG